MPHVHSLIRNGQLSSCPGSSTQPLSQLAVGGQVLPASWPQQEPPHIDQFDRAAMRSKEALTAMVIGAAALAAQHPDMMAPYQDVANIQLGTVPTFCYGTCSSTAGSSTSTPTPLHALQCLRDVGSLSTAKQPTVCARAGIGGAASTGVALQPCVGHCMGLDDSTSPLSASSRVAVNGALTPCGSEALSGPRPGCKRTYNIAFQPQPLLQYQQQLQLQHQQHQAAVLLQKQVQQQQLQQQAQAAARIKQASLQQQQQQQQQQLVLQRLLSSQTAACVAPDVTQQQQHVYHVPPQSHPGQTLLVSQGSGSSTTGSCGSLLHRPPACPPVAAAASTAPNALFLQQRHSTTQQQQTIANLFFFGSSSQQQQPAVAAGTSSAYTAATHPQQQQSQQQRHEQFIDGQSWSAYLHRLQDQTTQPPTKRFATASAYSAAAAAASAKQQRQQLLLLQRHHQQQQQQQQHLSSTYTSSKPHQQQLLMSAASSNTLHILSSPSSHASKLLTWAGQLLKCQLTEAYYLAQHIYHRSVSKLDDMLLITLGVNQPLDKVAMLVSLWMATKLEGHRRQVVGCSRLAAALQMVPWAVTSVELHIMQALGWRPYEGFREASCQVTELM